MRIAQVAPLTESVPPRTYGGTERIVSYLTEALVEMGHDVTLFASGDSQTSADLVAVERRALRLSNFSSDPHVPLMLQLAEVARMADKFDIIHFHTDFFHFPVWRYQKTPQLTTLHGRLDLDFFQRVFEEFSDMPVASISNSQRCPLTHAQWAGTVYNGIPANLFDLQTEPGDYLAFLGRFSPEKGPQAAIEIACKAEMPLKLAAKVDAVDRDYFANCIQPQLEHPLIEYIGEVNEQEKNAFLGGARALLFPIDWPEPFGLAMTEAMACGTPVIAFNRGSVPEVMRDGVSGRIVQSVDEAVHAVGNIHTIDRAKCREYFESRFTVGHMAEGYLRAYRNLLRQPKLAPRVIRAYNRNGHSHLNGAVGSNPLPAVG